MEQSLKFVEQSEKRLRVLDEERAKEARLLEEATQRVARLRTELAAESPHQPPPTVPADYAQELVHLRACAEELQRSRGRSRSLLVPSPDLFTGELQRGGTHRLSSVLETSIEQCGVVCQVKSPVQPNVNRWCRKLSARYGLRAHRVGEASHPRPKTQIRHEAAHPGPAHRVRRVPDSPRVENVEVLRGTQDASGTRRRRRLRALPWSWDSDSESDGLELTRHARRSQRSFPITQVAASSDEEVLVRSNVEGMWSPGRELPATVPASQTALNKAGMWVSPDQVPLHVLDALEDGLGPVESGQVPRSPCSSEFALPVQNRFAVLDPTVRGSSDLRSTAVDGSGVEAFPMTDDAAVQVPVEPFRRRPYHRLVFIPQSQGTPQSIQDPQYDESGVNAREQFRDSHGGTQQSIPVSEMRADVDSQKSLVEDDEVSTDDIDGVSPVEECRVSVEGAPIEDITPPNAAIRAGFVSLDSVNVVDLFRRRQAVMKSVPAFLRGPFRTVLHIALRQLRSIDTTDRERRWKLFLLAPRMFLHRHPRGGQISKSKCSTFSRKVSGWIWSKTASCAPKNRLQQPGGRIPARSVQHEL